MNTKALRFSTPDSRFGLSIDGALVQRILRLCTESDSTETGGILVGYYTEKHDVAVVTDISGPPSDSKRKHSTFIRGVEGLQKRLHQLWEFKRHYYLGEWHYHPHAAPDASGVDASQLKSYSENRTLKCPEPVMLIVGGNPGGDWSANAYVFPKGQSLESMQLVEAHEE